jgi:hypothetical protein
MCCRAEIYPRNELPALPTAPKCVSPTVAIDNLGKYARSHRPPLGNQIIDMSLFLIGAHGCFACFPSATLASDVSLSPRPRIRFVRRYISACSNRLSIWSEYESSHLPPPV